MDTLEHEDARTGGDGREDLLHLVRKAARPEPDGGRVETRLAVCELCGGGTDEFEVAALEAYCVGCCIPIGIWDGDLHPGARPWTLEPSGVPLPPVSPGPGPEPMDLPTCPAGHRLFHVAVALAFARDGAVRGITVGLQCAHDGALHLYVDNARVVKKETAGAPAQ
ncbi:hypothetical protein [Streptomyces sp. NPDC059533]|uniref:hypothetical protein n=1 Tax=unclassified Streptomyces TaxID=2593676 RepID=UPI0036D0ECEB